MPVALSTGKRQKKASRVFGEVVFHDPDNTSLCYSTSPSPMHANVKTLEDFDTNPKPTVLFDKEEGRMSREKHVSFVATDKENSVSNAPAEAGGARKSSVDSIRSTELSRLRASYQSPQRRDLVQKTQMAINNATESVIQSLNTKSGPSSNQALIAARKAKDGALKNRSKTSKSVRFQWKEETSEAKSFNQKLEENRRQIIAVQRKLASAHFKEKARSNEEMKMKKLSKLEQEYVFNSETYRDQQQKLKDEKDRNRKKSIETRAKLRQNHREGEERMKRMKELEEAAINDVRYDLYKSRNQVARSKAEARRKSFQFRAGDAKRIRNIRSKWTEDRLKQQHESHELTRAAAKDVEAYKKKMADERRDSLKSRNLEGRNRRQLEQQQYEDAISDQHKSYMLKWAGEKDAEAYKEQIQEERRKSLAGRNKESARHVNVMQELKSLAQEQEAESFMLKCAAEKDAKEYLAKMAEERRKSLQFRGAEARRHRQLEEEQRSKEVQQSLANAALKSDCQKDVENYQKECAERRRNSLQYRGKESKLQNLKAENQRLKKQDQDHKMFELETLARGDVEEYLKDCKRRRRKSLAFRAKEKRRHNKWKQQQHEKKLQEQRHTSHLRSLDAQHMQLSQQQERARMAMDALRSAGYMIKGNPFGDLFNL